MRFSLRETEFWGRCKNTLSLIGSVFGAAGRCLANTEKKIFGEYKHKNTPHKSWERIWCSGTLPGAGERT